MIRDEIITVLANCSAVAVILRNRIIASVTCASDETLHGYINGRAVSWTDNGSFGSTDVNSPFDIVELHTDEISFSKHSAVSSVSEIVPGEYYYVDTHGKVRMQRATKDNKERKFFGKLITAGNLFTRMDQAQQWAKELNTLFEPQKIGVHEHLQLVGGFLPIVVLKGRITARIFDVNEYNIEGIIRLGTMYYFMTWDKAGKVVESTCVLEDFAKEYFDIEEVDKWTHDVCKSLDSPLDFEVGQIAYFIDKFLDIAEITIRNDSDTIELIESGRVFQFHEHAVETRNAILQKVLQG